jgi:hypothetical protein
MKKPELQQPRPQLVYGEFVYWLSIIAAMICAIAPIIALAFPKRDVLDPHFLFAAIWEGKAPSVIWQQSAGGLPGGHFWLTNLSSGDAIIQLGLEVGCCCAGVGLLAASISYLTQKLRSYGWAIAALVIAVLIGLSAAGIYQQTA